MPASPSINTTAGRRAKAPASRAKSPSRPTNAGVAKSGSISDSEATDGRMTTAISSQSNWPRPARCHPRRPGGVRKSCPGRTVLRRRDDASAAELPATTYRTAVFWPTTCEAVIGRLVSDRNDLVDGADHGYRHGLHRTPHHAAAGLD